MKESMMKSNNLNPTGERLNKEDQNLWASPAEIKRTIIKQERKKLFVFLIVSNTLLYLFLTTYNSTPISTQVYHLEDNHSLLQINAKLHIPLTTGTKSSITIITDKGIPLARGFLLPKEKQSPLSELGPWKIEIPNNRITSVLKRSSTNLRIVPKETKDFSKKRIINEIKF